MLQCHHDNHRESSLTTECLSRPPNKSDSQQLLIPEVKISEPLLRLMTLLPPTSVEATKEQLQRNRNTMVRSEETRRMIGTPKNHNTLLTIIGIPNNYTSRT